MSHEIAQDILTNYNGKQISPGNPKTFRLNWASHSTVASTTLLPSAATAAAVAASQYSIFVGDLDSEVTDILLENAFRQRFHSVYSARVVVEPSTGKSKSYGFVKFTDYADWRKALDTMNGVFLLSRPMRVAEAASSKKAIAVASTTTPGMIVNPMMGYYGYPYMGYPTVGSYSLPPTVPVMPAAQLSSVETENSTVYIGNLDESATESIIRNIFGVFGYISSVRLTPGLYGFVTYTDRSSAERAIQQLNSTKIGPKAMKLSWGMSTAAAAPKPSNNTSSMYSSAPVSVAPKVVEVDVEFNVERANMIYEKSRWEFLLCELDQ